MLLPYIIKIGGMNDNRLGIDTAFCFFTVASCLMYGIRPDFKLGAFLSIPLFLNLLNQYDFSTFWSLTNNFTFSIGLLFLVHINSHIKEIERVFHKSVIISFYISLAFSAIAILSGHDFRLFILKAFGADVAIKEVYGVGFGKGGFLGNPNLTGAYYAFSIGSFLKEGRKKEALLPTLATLLTSSWPVCTAIALWAYIGWDKLKLNRILPYLLAVIALVVGFLILDEYSKETIDSGRFVVWKTSFYIFQKSNWFSGNGLGWFAQTYSKFYKPFRLTMRQEHNEFLASLYAFGPIGLGALIYAFKRLSMASNRITRAVIFSIFVNCLCNFPMHVTTLFIIIGFWAAIAYNEVNNDKTLQRQVASR